MKKEVASFTRRIIAYIIDVFILKTLILKPFNSYLKTFSTNLLALSITKELAIISLSIAILSLLYWTLLEFAVRQSIGKMITRIYVASTVKQFTLKQCFMRNISKTVSILLAFDVLYAFITKTHQRYSEKLSNTEVLVIKEK